MNCETRTRGKLCGREECKPCFKRSFASCEKSKYLAEGQEKPLLLAKNSHKKFSFICEGCKHSFETRLSDVSQKGRFCPFCSSQKLCSSDECELCFEKSFASQERVKYWHFEKNATSPRKVFKYSTKKFWFECGKCGHSFKTRLGDISRDHFCSFCGGKALCSDKDCEYCFCKSFASNDKAIFWNFEKNAQTPREVFMNTHKKIWFSCGVCHHDFKTILKSVSSMKSWCPFCGGKSLCGDEDCDFCFERSFASNVKSKFLCGSDGGTAATTRKHSNKRRSFVCEKGHKFESTINNISSQGQWCPKCKNKTETKLLKFLEEHFGDVVHQLRVLWCKNPETNKFLPFDFCVSKTIIELDGIQHYKQVSNWQSPELTQKNDRYKEEQALKNGYSVLRILQEDVWNDKIDWKSLLLEHIKDYETPIVKNLWEDSQNPQE
ncbi:uncharacterized protein conserved in bacteria [Kurlavirus BKC-1]|nr:uncharacterized protein conserved in bacteria [Kurlavirus BKC-1]